MNIFGKKIEKYQNSQKKSKNPKKNVHYGISKFPLNYNIFQIFR